MVLVGWFHHDAWLRLWWWHDNAVIAREIQDVARGWLRIAALISHSKPATHKNGGDFQIGMDGHEM